MELSWLCSPKDYWYATVSALIGAAIGIAWTIRHFNTQRRDERRKCLERLRSCIEFNLERLKQAKGQLSNNVIPNYPFDTAQMNHWLSQSHGVLTDELARRVDWQRFQLDHISSKFVVANSAIVTSSGQNLVIPVAKEYYAALVESLREHVERTLGELEATLGEVPKE